jgi:hypothetical protein
MKASAWWYNWATLFLRDIYGGLALHVGEYRIWDSKIWSRVPRESHPRMTALARASSNCKRQTRYSTERAPADRPLLEVATKQRLVKNTIKFKALNHKCQSQSYIATDSQSISKSWCRAPSVAHDQNFITLWQLRLPNHGCCTVACLHSCYLSLPIFSTMGRLGKKKHGGTDGQTNFVGYVYGRCYSLNRKARQAYPYLGST